MRGGEYFETNRLEPEPCSAMLSGAFLLSPIGWLPHERAQRPISVSFVSLEKGPDETGASSECEGVLLFSAN
jgi:hypothetical protein